MKELNEIELKKISGGGLGLWLAVTAGVIFIIGVVDGYIRPLKCRY